MTISRRFGEWVREDFIHFGRPRGNLHGHLRLRHPERNSVMRLFFAVAVALMTTVSINLAEAGAER